MLQFHSEMHKLRATGVKDPLTIVAKKFAEEATLLCFDEFQVNFFDFFFFF